MCIEFVLCLVCLIDEYEKKRSEWDVNAVSVVQ